MYEQNEEDNYLEAEYLESGNFDFENLSDNNWLTGSMDEYGDSYGDGYGEGE